MFVAVARIALAIPEAHSPKGKRQVVNKIVERVRGRFNASIAEVDGSELWQRAILGIAVVGNEHGFVQSSVGKVLAFIEELYLAPIVSRAIEVVPLGESLFGKLEWEKLEAKLAADLSDGGESGGGGGGARAVASPPSVPAERETWPGVRTLADAEGEGDPEAATFRAPPPDERQRGGKAKSIKMMSEAERAAALDALRAQMKRPKDG